VIDLFDFTPQRKYCGRSYDDSLNYAEDSNTAAEDSNTAAEDSNTATQLNL
jgi:hypothetical protein